MTTRRIDASDLIEKQPIEYLEGDATAPKGPGRRIIAHIVFVYDFE